jgi:hypothetical protein
MPVVSWFAKKLDQPIFQAEGSVLQAEGSLDSMVQGTRGLSSLG